MSQYLKYVLDRAGTPPPRKVIILRHEQEWANRQIVDEFVAVFEGVEVVVLPDGGGTVDCDLLVLPYLDDFLHEKPGGVPLYRQLRSQRGTRVMLYGLGNRKIDVMRAIEVMPYYHRCQRVFFWFRVLRRLHLFGTICRLQKWRKPQ